MNENLGHKDLELLRFYFIKEIKNIDKKLSQGNNNIVGFIIASMIDVLIVYIFSDILETFCILERILTLFILIGILGGGGKLISILLSKREKKKKISGEDDELPENIETMIDMFDNIACDGLLLCVRYINRYNKETIKNNREYLMNFYLFEIIHQLKKSCDIFEEIIFRKDIYISSHNSQLIDIYRINNFIDFALSINDFLQKEFANKENSKEINVDLTNINATITKWEKIEGNQGSN